MLTRLLSSFVFDISALDPIAFAAAAAALFGVGVAAAFVPALRAGLADPIAGHSANIGSPLRRTLG